MQSRWLMITLAGLLMAGCTSLNVSKELNDQKLTSAGEAPIANIHGDNFGIYLFGVWPLVTGDPAQPRNWVLFQDTVTESATVDMITKKSKELGATKTTDMTTITYSTGYKALFIFWYLEVQASGNAVK